MRRVWSDPLNVSEGGFRRVLLAFMGLAFLGLIGAAVAAGWVTQRTAMHTYWVNHTYRVELGIAEARRRLEQAENVRRGNLIVSQASFLVSYHDAADRLPAVVNHVAWLTRDNPVQRARFASVDLQLAAQLARQRQSFALVAAGRRDEALRLYEEEVAAHPVTMLRALFDAIAAEERALLRLRDAEQQRSVQTFYVILTIAGVLVAIVAFTSLLVVLRFTRDLTRSRDDLRRLNESLEDMVDERTADLTRANEEIQRFAYIVSHDLRAPLVNVMGFTAELEAANQALGELAERVEEKLPDLLTEEARLAVREDLPEAIGFIRTSTQKMDRLINAILKLSREGRRVIVAEPLDVSALVENIRDTLRHRLDDEGTTLGIEAPLPAVTSDRVAVEQILSNLIENAVKYRHPDRAGQIVVRGQRLPANRVAYEVEDNGRGIDPRDHTRVFDLFRRSGPQDQPGEGIGLAHVRALAYRLGGSVDMRSQLGQGATFRLTLPAVYQDPTA